MRMYDIIAKKRDKLILSKEEIDFFINGYVKKEIPDYQVSSLLMAIYLNGMNDDEIANLTSAIVKTGDIIDLSKINGKIVDKHSTGGVGDKTTLIVGPIVASLGGYIAKMSGRGLGHTGGTIDKLESIPGYNVVLDNKRFVEQVNDIGIAIISQSGDLAKGDKLLYALRDTTATVESIPLIASSIMSKKIAAGAPYIVLDVKTGNGAFMKNLDDSKKLAREMIKIGNNLGRKVTALITDMSEPLGYNIGNSLEVIEAIETLKGNGPKDLEEICIKLASTMLELSLDKSYTECEKLVKESIKSGIALDKLKELIIAQHGNPEVINNYDLFPKCTNKIEIYADYSGYITGFNTEEIGTISSLLGSSRIKLDDTIDYGAGIELKVKINDFVNIGDVIATLYTNKIDNMDNVIKMFLDSITISNNKVKTNPLVYEIIK